VRVLTAERDRGIDPRPSLLYTFDADDAVLQVDSISGECKLLRDPASVMGER
jgi:hypothetical protein